MISRQAHVGAARVLAARRSRARNTWVMKQIKLFIFLYNHHVLISKYIKQMLSFLCGGIFTRMEVLWCFLRTKMTHFTRVIQRFCGRDLPIVRRF